MPEGLNSSAPTPEPAPAPGPQPPVVEATPAPAPLSPAPEAAPAASPAPAPAPTPESAPTSNEGRVYDVPVIDATRHKLQEEKQSVEIKVEKIPSTSPAPQQTAPQPVVEAPQPPREEKNIAPAPQPIEKIGRGAEGRKKAHKKRAQKRDARLAHVLEYVHKHGSISNREAEKLLRITDVTAFRYLKKLVAHNQLVRIGKGRSVIYKAAEAVPEAQK